MSELAVIVASGGTDAFISLTEAGKTAREKALESAREVEAITGQISRATASEARDTIRALRSAAEACRKAVKKPYWDAGVLIDSTHEEFDAPLEVEEKRLTDAMDAFDTAERKKAAEAARLAQEEASRLEQEKQKALQDARKADTEEKRTELQQQAVQLGEQAQTAKAAVVNQYRPVGSSSRPVWRGTVTDAKALYAARPDLVDLVPSQGRINAAIAGGMRECAGLTIVEGSKIR